MAAPEELLFERLCKVDPTIPDTLLKHRHLLRIKDYDRFEYILKTEDSAGRGELRFAFLCVFDSKLIELGLDLEKIAVRRRGNHDVIMTLFPFLCTYGDIVKDELLAAGNDAEEIWPANLKTDELRFYFPMFYSLEKAWDIVDNFLSETDTLLETMSVENTSRHKWATFIKCMITADRYDASGAVLRYLNYSDEFELDLEDKFPCAGFPDAMGHIESLIGDNTKHSTELKSLLHDSIEQTSTLPSSMVTKPQDYHRFELVGKIRTFEHKRTGEIHAFKRIPYDNGLDYLTFYKKARVLQQLRHKNVLPFMGTTGHLKGFIISPWMDNGSLNTFIERYDDVDRVDIISQIASGMRYLHSQQPVFIHGNLRAENILVDDHRCPVITGFHNRWWQPDPLKSRYDRRGSCNWRAPETRLKGSYLSTASDVYAFAVTCLEIFTGNWGQHTSVRPESPTVLLRGLDDDMWDLIRKCRSKTQESRPTISEICNFPPIAKNIIIRALHSVEEDFLIHSSRDSASGKMREFVLTIQRWLIDFDLISLLDSPTLERIFAIILEKCPLDDLIKLINNEYSAAGRTRLIDVLHEMLQFEIKFNHRRQIDQLLTRLVKETGQIPSLMIIKDVKRNGPDAVAGGGFADVWSGLRGNINVALKVLRIFGEGELNMQILRAFCSEVLVWHRLHHSNVMPFLGVSITEFAPRYALVSPWMKNGHLLRYLRDYPLINRKSMMFGIAKGLEYLHTLQPAVIHGDLRATNVLIDDDGQPRISDFGLARIYDSQGGSLGQTSYKGGSWRWSAPEILDPSRVGRKEPCLTTKSDIYAFAFVCLEIFTEKAPFWGFGDGQVLREVTVNDGRPPRPPQPAEERGLSDAVWSLIQDCWAVQPADRPIATAVHSRIQDIVANQGSVKF